MSMKVSELYKTGAAILKEANVSDWDYDSRVLLEWICGVSRLDLLLEPNKEIEEEKAQLYLSYIGRRGQHEPLQYLVGQWEFMGFPFKVNPSVLIPRQDTEVLIEWILENEKSMIQNRRGNEPLKILDVCTGSGCIAISLDLLFQEEEKDCVKVTALDVSEDALCTARENRDLNQSDVSFIQSNMFDKVEGKYDIIVSNPPYIPTKVVDGLMEEVVRFEPRIALDGKEDGLHFYRILAKEGGKYLKPGGRIYFEIGHDQGETVPLLLDKEGFIETAVRKDLAGNDRCVRAVFPE